MLYTVIFLLLFILEVIYFKVANHFNIIDKPNERSSHSTITLRGGGIIFYIGVLIFFILSGFQYPYFFIGLSLMTAVSFIDDILTLSNKIRLIVHFISVILMAYELQIFDLPIYYIPITFVLVVGVINAYNFMDGINGITAAYSIAVTSLLLFVNNRLMFIEQDLLIYTLLSLFVFSFFNFRIKAKCFAGDVGSVAIAFILLFAIASLILKTGNLIYIIFLGVYGIDAIWTIFRRLYLKENIFEAHRSHLYQYLANEAGVNKLLVSCSYAFLQIIIGFLVIWISNFSLTAQIVFSLVLFIILSFFYLLIKNKIIKKYLHI